MIKKTSLLLISGVISLSGLAQFDYSTIPYDTTSLWSIKSGYWAGKEANVPFAGEPQGEKNSPLRIAATGNVVLMLPNQNIAGFDAENGNTIFSSKKNPDIPAIFPSSYEEVPGSPFFKINSNRKTIYINSITGETIVEKTKDEEEDDKSTIKKVTDQYVLPKASSVIYAGRTGWKAGMELKNLQTGQGWVQDNIFTWKMQELIITGAPFEVSAEEFILPLDKGIYCVNTKTGELKWRTYISPPMGSFDAPSSGTTVTNTPEPGPSLLFKHADKSYIYMINDNGLTAFDLATGKEVWKKYRKATYDCNPIFTPQGLLIVSENVQLLDYDTGEPLLKKTSATKGKVTSYCFVNAGIAVNLTMKNNKDQPHTELNIIDPATGLFKFEKNFKTYGNVLKIMPCDKGVFYITDRAIGIWDQSTGLDAFEPVSVTTQSQTFVGGEKYNADYVSQVNGMLITTYRGSKSYTYNTETDILYEIDTKTGVKKEFGQKISNFKPDFIEARKSGIFISSRNKMVLFNYDGQLVYNQHFPPPGQTLFEKFVSFADAAYANYYIMNEPFRKEPGPQLTLQDAKNIEGSNFDKAKALFANNVQVQVNLPKAKAQITQRYEDSKKEIMHTYIVTSMKNGASGEEHYGLAKVNRDTGKVEKVFPFGQNRKPQFMIDETSEKLFFLEKDNLHCYKL